MAALPDAVAEIARAQLTPAERAGAAAYVAQSPLPAATRLDLAGTVIETESEAYIAFIDRDPTANWGHAARYLIFDLQGGPVRSVETRRPPFNAPGGPTWRVIYQAPSVPDAAVAFSQ
jgi:hypothetical protein